MAERRSRLEFGTGFDVATLTPGARRILDVASRLFYEQGIHAVGVDTIAAESKVTKPILYKNFGNKDGLVVAYLRHRHDTWWETLEAAIAAAAAPRALAFFDVYAEDTRTIKRGCAYLNAAAELREGHPAYPVIRHHKHAVCRRLAELITEDLPHVAKPKLLADHLFLLLEGAFAHHQIYGADLLIEARETAESLLRC
ncbi:transcriptional regulator [Saccharomonospora sp. CUA-673]|uniref:TetR/AcrR family transcriptional regulator n=1 Tax=Saccharomonospora sp. CUA-673 TaxID=1904969 RepID=UPI000964A465|nr:TetR/AcrR family transcriptional regulator [Saccharomonospora sp. CUA-673]OLT45234.1 transcriptional regulator [Saccharomonospora sp. CUA-673]